MATPTSPPTISPIQIASRLPETDSPERRSRPARRTLPQAGRKFTDTDRTRPGSAHRALALLAFAIALLYTFGSAQTASAQSPTPLAISNNYFVTGDYVVGGVGLRGLGDATGFAHGNITIPDPKAYASSGVATEQMRVPDGADIVAAFLYWATVETSGTFAGQKGSFGPSSGNAYPITGTILGNPNAPTSWSSGGCSGSSQGSKTIVTYRADVRPYLPLDANGTIQPNATYQVSLADSGNGNTPFTLGATLVIIYRVISTTAHVPLNAVIIYDGSYAPGNTAQTMTQQLQGFYKVGNDQGLPVAAKITHIVGNGQANKVQQVYLNNYDSAGKLVHSTLLPSLYGTDPPFPGKYNGSWDDPTWFPNTYATTPAGFTAVHANDSSETTLVVPASTNKGCVNWGAIILSTTIQDSDLDGLVDTWKAKNGYCDAGANRGMTNQGTCPLGDADPSWVALPGAQANEKDIFLQIDAMCSKLTVDGTACDTANGGISQLPDPAALANVVSAFFANGHAVHVHIDPNHQIIPEQTCVDTVDKNGNPVLCPFPGQAGVVGWKSGFEYLKTQPLNYPDEASCESSALPGGAGPFCIRRFPLGRRNSYHEVIFANALGVPSWSFQGGSLISIVASGNNMLTFTTSSSHGLVVDTGVQAANARVTIFGVGSNLSLNGTFLVKSVPTDTSFTIQTASSSTVPTPSTDPYLAIAPGTASTGSGFSDLGGGDSLITLGLWGVDGRTVPVQSGTLMHEIGHSLGLTHGGSYADTANSYALTFEANCKPNYQSVMNYMFQVDLLADPVSLTDSILDYSNEPLPLLNEKGPLSATVLNGALHPLTKWYTPNQPIGTPATRHCDGTPILPNDQPAVQSMFRVEGPTSSIPWPATPQDINFDGKVQASLRGYKDWDNIDLRQIGATSNDFWAGGAPFGSGGAPFGSGGAPFGSGGAPFGSGGAPYGSGGAPFGSGGAPFGSGGAPFGSGGVGEITPQIANSVVRPPTKLSASLTASDFVSLSWTAPTFGQSLISSFRVYRSENGGAFPRTAYTTVPQNAPLPLSNFSYTDQQVGCETYSYLVTTVLTDGRESVPSNSTSAIAVPCIFIGFLSPLTTAGTVTAPSFSPGNFSAGKAVNVPWKLTTVGGIPITNLKTLSSIKACPNSNGPNGAPPANAVCVTLFSGGTPAGNSTFSFSNSQFIFKWDTASTIGSATGYYTIELQLSDGSAFRATTIKLK